MNKSDEDANVDNVRLIATSLAGPANQLPVANAGGTYDGSEDASVMFDASGSTDPDGTIAKYTWDFGDGTDPVTTTAAAINHTYLWGAAFNVTLTVEDDRGGMATGYATATIAEVNDPPVADPRGPYNGVVNLAVSFDGSGSSDFDNQDGTTANNQTLTYTWNFGDGSEAGTGIAVSHTYAVEGTYTVTLTVGDGIANDVESTTVEVTSEPVATTVHVSDLDGTVNDLGRFWEAVVTITVLDDADVPIPNATLYGTWSGNTSGTEIVTTNASGQAIVVSDKVLDKKDSVVFTVDNIVHESLSYDSAGNADPDGDSNGTSIVVFQDGGTASPASLRGAGGSDLAAPVPNLTQDLAVAAAREAMALWSWQSRTALPPEIQVHVSDLPSGTLGWAYGSTIVLDQNANGAGWYVDLSAPAAGRVDLLTVVSHELGHLLGYGHNADEQDIMAPVLPPGTRRLPGSVGMITPEPNGSVLDSAPRHAFDHTNTMVDARVAPTTLSDLWLLPVAGIYHMDRLNAVSEAAAARILQDITDDETELLDEELAALLAVECALRRVCRV